MVQRHHVHGYDGFQSLVKTIPAAERINVLFTGTKENGISWCPDCVEGEYRVVADNHLKTITHPIPPLPAEPFIEKAVESAAADQSHFIVVEVGNRTL